MLPRVTCWSKIFGVGNVLLQHVTHGDMLEQHGVGDMLLQHVLQVGDTFHNKVIGANFAMT